MGRLIFETGDTDASREKSKLLSIGYEKNYIKFRNEQYSSVYKLT